MAKGTKTKVKSQAAVVMESEVARKIRQHSRSSMKAEVCGVLIGSTENESTLVQACITGTNAAQGGTHVTFTQDTWEHIYKIKDREYPDEKIVGWYHSHPGFGVFLSEHDLFIQENFFSSPHQIAWVYDPHTDEEGCFGWVDGKVEKLPGVRFGYVQTVDTSASPLHSSTEDEDEEDGHRLEPVTSMESSAQRREPVLVDWIFRAVMYLSILGMGFIGGFLYVHYQVDPVLRGCEDLLRHVIPVQPGDSIPSGAIPSQPQNSQSSASPGSQATDKANNGKH